MRKISPIKDLKDNISSVSMIFDVALTQRESPISQEAAALYTAAAGYFNKVMQSAGAADEKLKSSRSSLIELIKKDQKNWFSNLSKPLGEFKLTFSTDTQKKLTPALMIALAAAYDPDEKAANLVYQQIKKEKLGSKFKWNSAGDNLAQIAAHENLLRLTQFLWENKIYSSKEFFQPETTCPAAIASRCEHEDLNNYFEEISHSELSNGSQSSKVSFAFGSQLNQGLLSDPYELRPLDTSKSLNS